MPPKRTRYASGSRAPPPPSPVPSEDSMQEEEANRFITPEAEAEYHKLLTKPVAKERGFLPTTDDGQLLQMIQDKG